MNQIETLKPETVTAELVKIEQRTGLDETSAVALRERFGSFQVDIIGWRDKLALITDPADPRQQNIAREVRLGLKGVRCDVERGRKKLIEDSTRWSRAVNERANYLKGLCDPVEAQLLEIEQYAERIEAARVAEMVTCRTVALAGVEGQPEIYDLAKMDKVTFEAVYEDAVRRRDARLEAERQAEAARIAAEATAVAERERLRAENARLEKEAAAREEALRAERLKVAQKEAEALRVADIERIKATNRIKAAEAETAKVRAAAVKATQDAAAAEIAAAQAERAAANKAKQAPDKEKLVTFATMLRGLAVPVMRTEAGQAVADSAAAGVLDLARWVEESAAGL